MKKTGFFFAAAALCCLACPAAALKVPAGVSSGSLTLPDGFKVSVELALTPEQQARGLMFRTSLAPDCGMLFIFPYADLKNFWMKNTLIDLDMVFLNSEFKVLKVFHRVPRSYEGQPEAELARAACPARMVLELAAGTARAHQVKPGSLLTVSFHAKVQKK